MLRIIQNQSAAGAKSYYTTADYYTEGQELAGHWRGQGAERLGLFGKIENDDWSALCDNRHPETGDVLTLRQRAGRRIGYDFNFHVPKSVSLLYGLTRDERLLDAFRESVRETMDDMEAEMKTRVRKLHKNEDRTTGNMVWGEFIHFTSRPVDGVPDPHLHAHCFVFNTTWDSMEAAWKAGQFADLKRDASYFEAAFHTRFARRLGDLGLEVSRRKKGWELSGLDAKTLDKFSRRTQQIEAKAKQDGILDPMAKSELGAKTRERKQKDLTLSDLRYVWDSRLTEEERTRVESLALRVGGDALPEDQDAALPAIEKALDHCFERKSVVPERTLLTESLKRGMGQASLETLQQEFQKQKLVTADRDGRRMATTPTVLAEEKRMIAFAREGRGTQSKLGNPDRKIGRDWLNAGQRQAVEHVLGSRDRVILIRGAAGVGKTAMMQEAVEGIREHGHEVFAFAPSADASRGTLRDVGFENADTVARLLVDKQLQESIKGEIIWIDEAGLLGTRTMSQVFDLADKLEARVILSGDRRQHGSVERGAALRLLETEAGLVPAEIKEIQRQRGAYKEAMHELSEGNLEEGFRQIDQLGWIREAPPEERYRLLAEDYVKSVQAGETALVVSPTHLEGERITGEIRTALQKVGSVDAEQHLVRRLESLNLTEAERADVVNYAPGDVIEFHQNAKGFEKGQQLEVGDTPLPFDQARRFQAYHAGEIALAAGDVIRITKNGQTLDKQHRLNNGSLYRVKGFDTRGNLQLDNGWIIAKNFGHLTYGYVVTSHASQGKTVDHVFIGQSSASWGASSREQFYVSASRGRKQVSIYTDDKASLLKSVNQTDPRLTATELVTPQQIRRKGKTLRRQELLNSVYVPMNLVSQRTKDFSHDDRTNR